MKNTTLLIVFLATSLASFAQGTKIEITPTAGYTFSSRMSYYQAETDVVDNYSIGLALDVRLQENMLVELMYHNINTDFNTTLYNGLYGREYYSTPVALEYYQLGIVREVEYNDKVIPFTSFTLGMTRFHPNGEVSAGSEDGGGNTITPSHSDQWALSAALGGGAKIMFSERIGLKLQARLMAPMYFNGIGIYCGGGCGGGASFGIYTLQLDLSGGIVIGLGEY